MDYKDIQQLSDVADIYIRLCYENEKEISIDGFSKLTGIHKQTLYNWEHKDYRYNKYISVDTGEEIKDIAEWKLNNRGEYKTEPSTSHFDFIQKYEMKKKKALINVHQMSKEIKRFFLRS